VTGNKYVQFNEENRIAWVTGVIDGLIAESIQRDNQREPGSWLGECIEGLPNTQFKAIFEKELYANPEAWHAPAAFMLRDKMESFCASRLMP
jgi:hypothetical protein